MGRLRGAIGIYKMVWRKRAVFRHLKNPGSGNKGKFIGDEQAMNIKHRVMLCTPPSRTIEISHHASQTQKG